MLSGGSFIPGNLHDLGHFSWVGYVLFRSYTSPQNGRLESIDDLDHDLSDLDHDLSVLDHDLSARGVERGQVKLLPNKPYSGQVQVHSSLAILASVRSLRGSHVKALVVRWATSDKVNQSPATRSKPDHTLPSSNGGVFRSRPPNPL